MAPGCLRRLTFSFRQLKKVPGRPPPFWLLMGARKLLCFSAQSKGRTAATVWNWSGKTLSPGALLAVLYFSLCHYFSARLDFPSPPLSAPGSPRMSFRQNGSLGTDFRRNCQYFSDRRRAQLAMRSN